MCGQRTANRPGGPAGYLLIVTVTSPRAGVVSVNGSPGFLPAGISKQASVGFVMLTVFRRASLTP